MAEKIYTIRTKEELLEFTQNLSALCLYSDEEGSLWRASELKEAICNSSIDYEYFFGIWKESK